MPERENDAIAYGVNVEPARVEPGESYWMAVKVHHLTPEENQGRSLIYIDILDEKGGRIYGAQARVSWPGGSQIVTVDKPLGEPGANFPLWPGQLCSVEALGLPSDRVFGIHNDHPDEGPGNRRFQHSFLVVFQKVVKEEGRSTIKGEVVGGVGKTIVLLKKGEAVGAQVIGPDERFAFSRLSAGIYSLAIPGTDLRVADIKVDGFETITLRLVLEEKSKSIYHYLLFGTGLGAQVDLLLALDYVLHFGPVVGFSLEEASNAVNVTIVGGTDRISLQEEELLRNKGCTVRRISGDAYQIKETFRELVEKNTPFPSS
ncbi:MAG: hypothetical protein RMK30_04550 [Anaerolineae bacterium]|nr:hypothetical protein [Anaerolineae bacterium]MDW8102132.1 hypothetical protein [Anaerolineae bacterium]